jgi:hypothetical protein
MSLKVQGRVRVRGFRSQQCLEIALQYGVRMPIIVGQLVE